MKGKWIPTVYKAVGTMLLILAIKCPPCKKYGEILRKICNRVFLWLAFEHTSKYKSLLVYIQNLIFRLLLIEIVTQSKNPRQFREISLPIYWKFTVIFRTKIYTIRESSPWLFDVLDLSLKIAKNEFLNLFNFGGVQKSWQNDFLVSLKKSWHPLKNPDSL